MAKKRPPVAMMSGATPEQTAALDSLIQAETKAVEDYRKGLITFQQATNELKSVAAKYARDAGVTQRALGVRSQNNDSTLRDAAGGIPVLNPVGPNFNQRGAAAADELAPSLGKMGYMAGRFFRGAENAKAGGVKGLGGKFTVADVVSEAAKDAFQNATRAIYNFADAATSVAKNDGFGLLNKAIDSTAGALGKIPIVGKAVEAELKMLVAPINAVNQVATALVERARELSSLNGTIAVASAQSDIRQLYADMKEANQLAKQYASITDAKSTLDNQMQEALTELKALLIPVVTPLVDFLTVEAAGVGEVFKAIRENSDAISAGLQAAFPIAVPILKAMKDDFAKMAEILRKDNEANQAKTLDDLLRFAGQVRVGVNPVDQAADAGRQRMGVPLLQR